MPSRMARALFQGGGLPMDQNQIGQTLMGAPQQGGAPLQATDPSTLQATPLSGRGGGQQPQQPQQPPQNPFDQDYIMGLAQDDPWSAIMQVLGPLSGPTGFAQADRMGETFGPSPAPSPQPQPQPNTGQNTPPLQATPRSGLSRRNPSGFNPMG